MKGQSGAERLLGGWRLGDGRARVLVVEDDEDLRVAIVAELRAGGFDAGSVADLAAAGAELDRAGYDCVVFDRMLPDGDAIGFVDRRRKAGWTAKVLFLTARDSLADRIAGFAHGGDDYLVKPFAVAEMAARVRALCGRAGAGRPPVLRYGDLEMDCARREVRRAGTLLTLSGKEFGVLEYLMTRPERVVGRDELIEHCWDDSTEPMANVVDVVIFRLRAKLAEPDPIVAVRGHGYRMAAL